METLPWLRRSPWYTRCNVPPIMPMVPRNLHGRITITSIANSFYQFGISLNRACNAARTRAPAARRSNPLLRLPHSVHFQFLSHTAFLPEAAVRRIRHLDIRSGSCAASGHGGFWLVLVHHTESSGREDRQRRTETYIH